VIVAIAAGGWLIAAGLAMSARWVAASRAADVARACHELRGPLCAIGLGVEFAGRTGGHLPSARLRALELELGRARQALDDLTVAGGVRARAHPTRAIAPQVRLGALVREATDAWSDAAGARGIRVELPPEEVFVAGERVRLAQALCNLLANAVEHGEGDVSVRLRAAAGIARIDVCDRGRGLPGQLAGSIGSRPRNRWSWLPRARVPERGHGLRIAAGVARAHGGRLISAPSDRGARLVLELPLARVESGRRAAV
jgi:signal transduction histidine kinase